MFSFGLIGYGKMGKIRAQTAIDLGANLVSYYDPNETINSSRKVKKVEELIKDASIDSVFISTPNFMNAELTIKCLQAGKNVFCEKPPALNLAELNQVKKVHSNSEKTLMYGFNHRYHESIIHMRNLIQGGEYGKLIWMRGRYGKSTDENFFDSWRAKRKYSGGGIIIDQGIHMLDLFLLFAGEFDSVHAALSNGYWGLDIEDNAFITLENKKEGVSASLHSTMTQWRHLFSLEVFLEGGYMVLNGLKTSSGAYGDEVLTLAKNRSKPPAASWEEDIIIKYPIDYSWKNEIMEFLSSIQEKRDPIMGNINDAINVMSLIDEIYK